MKKYVSLFLLGLFIFVLNGCQDSIFTTEEPITEETTTETILENDYIKQFASEEALKTYFSEMQYFGQRYGLFANDAVMTPESGADTTTETVTSKSHSETNVQVDGVNEIDSMITDGHYIYMASGQDLRIFDALSMEEVYHRSLTSMSTDDIYRYGYYYGIYLYEGLLIAIYSDYSYVYHPTRPMFDYWWGYSQSKIVVEVINVSDLENINIERTLEFNDAYINDSRMIDDQLYLIMTSYSRFYGEEAVTPRYKDSELGDELIQLSYQDVYYFPDNTQVSSYLLIGQFSVIDDEEIDLNAYLGYAYEVYMNHQNLYLSAQQYIYDPDTYRVEYLTNILRFEIIDGRLVFRASNQINGFTLNQFSYDEYEGVLRVATTDYIYHENGFEITNQLYLLDATDEYLTEISMLGGLGKPGERIYAVRMHEGIGYVVTFVQTDPLYKLDLSDPENPEILGEHYEDGVSDYLHLINEELMVGVGREAKEQNGWVNFVGVKVALYDTSDDTPILLRSLFVEGEYSYSPVTYDHKQFVEYQWNDDFLFAIPVYQYAYGWGEYYLSIFLYQVTEDRDLIEVKEMRVNQDGYGYYVKALFIGDYIYTISFNEISRYDMSQDFAKEVYTFETNQSDGDDAVRSDDTFNKE